MAVNKLIFKNSEDTKFAIMESQQKEIAKFYEDWADEIGERAKYYSHKLNASAPVSERYYKELQKQLRATSQEVSNEVYKKIKSNIYTISDAVVSDNIEWLKSFGFSSDGLNASFSYVPNEIVQKLITGQIYDSGWSLSSRIWGDNEQTLKDIYHVMARGIAENKSIYEIAKDLESYVRPSENLPWNLRMGDGKKIYKKQVDYNAQRLARTLVQHGYQQSFIETTQKNPFITEYVWRSNGSRACELCLSRDGVHYKKTELPMDHPNGMCTMEPFVADDMIDQLANWFNSSDGTYPEIDKFAGNFGYEVNKSGTVKDFIDKYGMSTKSPTAWYNSLTPIQKAEAKDLKDKSGLTWNQWYEKNIHETGKIEKSDGTSTIVKSILDEAKKNVDDISSKVSSEVLKKNDIEAKYTDKQIKSASKFLKVKEFGFKDNNIDSYMDALKSTNQQFQNAFVDALKKKVKNWNYTSKGSCYLNGTNEIKLDYEAINAWLRNANSSDIQHMRQTLFHEIGHAIDDLAPGGNARYSRTSKFSFQKAMLKDMREMNDRVKSGDKDFIKSLNDMIQDDSSKGVQDAISAMHCKGIGLSDVKLQVKVRWSHSQEYYERSNAKNGAASELFANMCGSKVDPKAQEYMKKYFPNSVEEFERIIDYIGK